MDQNRDWKPIIALALAGLALFLALGSSRGWGDRGVSTAPQQVIVQPVAPSSGTQSGGTVATVPGAYAGVTHAPGAWGWGGGHHFFPFFPLLFFGGLIFLAFFLFGRNRHRWGGPGGWGRPGSGTGAGPQGPPYAQYGQYPPQHYYPPQGQPPDQPNGGYHQEQPPQGQPTQAIGGNGDRTRPEGSTDY